MKQTVLRDAPLHSADQRNIKGSRPNPKVGITVATFPRWLYPPPPVATRDTQNSGDFPVGMY